MRLLVAAFALSGCAAMGLERFVFTPRDLHVVKKGIATEIVLRKNGDRIDVVELR